MGRDGDGDVDVDDDKDGDGTGTTQDDHGHQHNSTPNRRREKLLAGWKRGAIRQGDGDKQDREGRLTTGRGRGGG
jgi:hypothetical protein